MRPFCDDGRDFIPKAVDMVLEASQKGESADVPIKGKPKVKQPNGRLVPTTQKVPIPPTISHFVMNLPALAIEFVGSYRGCYAGHEGLFAPNTDTKLPMVHVHCFSYKMDDDTPAIEICERLSKFMGFPMKPGDPEVEGEVQVYDVRDVAPAKRMFCASFGLPREVAFAPRG